MLRWRWVPVSALEFMQTEHCFFWIWELFLGHGSGVFGLKSIWHQPVSSSLQEYRSPMYCWFSPSLSGALFWASKFCDSLWAFNFISASSICLVFRHDHSFLLLLSSREFHVLLLISLRHTRSLQLWRSWFVLSLSVAVPCSDVWIELVTGSLFALCK